MEAKDTVKRITDDDRRYLTPPQLAKLRTDRLAQAKISFKAGEDKGCAHARQHCEDVIIPQAEAEARKAGVRKVVEWIELNKFHTDGFPCYNAQSWQAKLKEWEVKDETVETR